MNWILRGYDPTQNPGVYSQLRMPVLTLNDWRTVCGFAEAIRMEIEELGGTRRNIEWVLIREGE